MSIGRAMLVIMGAKRRARSVQANTKETGVVRVDFSEIVQPTSVTQCKD